MFHKALSQSNNYSRKRKNRLTSLTPINSIFLHREVLQSSNLVQVIFDLLNDSRSPVFTEVVHGAERLENPAPLLGLGLYPSPQVFHDDVVVFPVIGVIGKHLQFAI